MTPPDGPGSYIPGAQTSNNDDEYQSGGVPSGSGTTYGDTTLLIDLGTCSAQTANSESGSGSNCGIEDADLFDTMIQAGNSYGTQGVTVTFYGVNGSGAAVTPDSFNLTAGVDYRDARSNLTGAANCTAANPGTSPLTTGCAGTNDTLVNSAPDPSNSNITIFSNVFGAETQSSVNYYIDIQQFNLQSLFQNGGYLDQVAITYTSQTSSVTNSRTMTLSGVSADTTAATPEPGTVGMLGIGLGLIGFWKIRSRRANGAPSVE